MNNTTLTDLKQFIQDGFTELRDDMNQRFNAVNARFEQMDLRFEQMDERFKQIDRQLDGMDQRMSVGFEEVDDKLQAIMQAVGERHQDHEQRITRLEAKLV